MLHNVLPYLNKILKNDYTDYNSELISVGKHETATSI